MSILLRTLRMHGAQYAGCMRCRPTFHLRIYVGLGGPGSTADVTAFKCLSIEDLVDKLPEGFYVLGDAAYVTSDKLLTPFTGVARSVWYKVAHSHRNGIWSASH